MDVKKIGLVLMLAVMPLLLVFAGGDSETVPAEESPVAVAEVVDMNEDWDQIYASAQEEGKVTVYSLSSRIFDAVENFKTLYPGVEVEAIDISSIDQIEKLTREQNAGLYNVDVVFLSGRTILEKELLPKGMVVNYVPSTLLGGQKSVDVIPENLRYPLLVHSLESKVIFYNTETFAEAPVDNLWDLTTPEWNGRVQMKDPMASPENMRFLQMAVKNADSMAKAYKDKFGEDITLSSGVENAGLEWILRLIENNLVLTTSDGTGAKAVGAREQTNPPLTLSCASSKLRYNDSKDTVLGIAWDVEPAAGLTKANFVLMANNAPHPNAAKLLIRYMLGAVDESGGFGPFRVPGQWASRSDIIPITDEDAEEVQQHTWVQDADFIYNEGLQIRDFWLSIQ